MTGKKGAWKGAKRKLRARNNLIKDLLKKNQRWFWYAWEPKFKRVIAHAFGHHNADALQILLQLLEPFIVRFSVAMTLGLTYQIFKQRSTLWGSYLPSA